ncbi:hypothetical protein, partial [Saccharothrix violaceirubra]|uniref:hypothetical protein n=1 Tax=Saccharothrix violaceirubra TaxID=413306 RepID=UPI0031EADE37
MVVTAEAFTPVVPPESTAVVAAPRAEFPSFTTGRRTVVTRPVVATLVTTPIVATTIARGPVVPPLKTTGPLATTRVPVTAVVPTIAFGTATVGSARSVSLATLTVAGMIPEPGHLNPPTDEHAERACDSDTFPCAPSQALSGKNVRRRPTLPHPHECSTIGAG